MQSRIEELLARPDVRAARAWIESHDAETIALQRTIAEIPAPGFDEARRGAFVAQRFRETGLADVHTDAVGNVIARYGEGNAPGVVICSHLDTVFPEGTPTHVTSHGQRLTAPGIGDNARGLAGMLAVAEAMACCQVQAGQPITFVASVGEEGEGDLRGVKHFFNSPSTVHRLPSAFIALDGPGLDRIVHRALGSRRVRVIYKGPGGHSWAAFGVPNPAHAVGIAVAGLAEIQLPATPRAALSVVRIGGGQSLNTIPVAAWLEYDLRAESNAVLDSLSEAAKSALRQALDQVNRGRAAGTPPLIMDVESLGERPSGVTAETHALVQAAVAATRVLGGNPGLATASTDANVPISMGIPGIALGAGGKGGDAHLVSEWYENVNGPAGIIRCLLVALSGEVSL